MTEEIEAPQGLADAEPVATPEDQKNDAPEDKGGEQSAKPEPKEGEPKEEPKEPKQEPWFVKRLESQRQKLAEKDRIIEELRQASPPPPRREQRDEPQHQRQQSDRSQSHDDIEKRAAQIVEHREYQASLERWDRAGRTEFPDFVDRCNAVANMGASDRPEFMQIVAHMDDGHKVVAHLADHPDEALRILSLPANRMALELGRMSEKGYAPKPAPQSAAPRPIKPLVGSGTVETDPEKMSMDEWVKWREKQSAN